MSRKKSHDDGPGCLADLASITALDAKYASTLVPLRAECDMLVEDRSFDALVTTCKGTPIR